MNFKEQKRFTTSKFTYFTGPREMKMEFTGPDTQHKSHHQLQLLDDNSRLSGNSQRWVGDNFPYHR